ncbi:MULTISPECIES: hypothetical protein [unclassified Streptomyces]|nr:hypothetical protein [Streptomyces sp. NBC_01445]WSE03740.1 hypothetical protein OG574_10370 [Streptomyces sp. NBC_01445]
MQDSMGAPSIFVNESKQNVHAIDIATVITDSTDVVAVAIVQR